MPLISDKILKNIEKSLGLDLFEDKEREDIMKAIVKLISTRAGIRIMEGLSEEEAKEFNNIPEGNDEKIKNYLLSKNPSVEKIFEEEAEKAKEEILNMKIGVA